MNERESRRQECERVPRALGKYRLVARRMAYRREHYMLFSISGPLFRRLPTPRCAFPTSSARLHTDEASHRAAVVSRPALASDRIAAGGLSVASTGLERRDDRYGHSTIRLTCYLVVRLHGREKNVMLHVSAARLLEGDRSRDW